MAYKTIAEARKAGSKTFTGKDGKKKAAVTREELAAWEKKTGKKGLRAYLNAQNAASKPKPMPKPKTQVKPKPKPTPKPAPKPKPKPTPKPAPKPKPKPKKPTIAETYAKNKKAGKAGYGTKQNKQNKQLKEVTTTASRKRKMDASGKKKPLPLSTRYKQARAQGKRGY